MSDFIKFIGSIFSSFYNVFNVKLFPDMPITVSEMFLGFLIVVGIIKLFFVFSSQFGSSTQFDFYKIGNFSKRSNDGYKPKHASTNNYSSKQERK